MISLLIRSVIAGVLLVAGIAKAKDRRGSASAAERLGVPARLAPAVAVLLPPVEIGLGLTLFSPAARPAALASAVLFAVFSVLIVRALVQGERGSCGCFGSLSRGTLSWWSVARNLALIAGAGTAVALPATVSTRTLAVAAASTVWFAAAASFVAHLRATDALDESLVWNGRPRRARDLIGEHGALMVFLHPGCGPCRDIVPRVRAWQATFAPAVVAISTVEDRIDGLDAALGGERLAERLGVAGTPSAILFDARGSIVGTAGGAPMIEALVASHPAAPAAPTRVPRRLALRGALTTAGAATAALMGFGTARADHSGPVGSLPLGHELCGCPQGHVDCNGQCKDVRIDHANCGACANVCPPGTRCEQGACVTTCGSGLEACGDDCVNLMSDPANCGACANACPPGDPCTNGVCGCPSGTTKCPTDCGSSCIDVSSDPQNCGACANACPPGTMCVAGACQCPSGTVNCGTGCVDVSSDPQHCGACGNACPAGAMCIASTCQCPTGTVNCGTACVDVSSDPDNCGGCGTFCPPGTTCSAGACV